MKVWLVSLVVALPLLAQSNRKEAATPLVSSASDSRITALPASAGVGEAIRFPETRNHLDGRTFYRWSQVAVFAANGADTVSSWNQSEGNPLLAKSGGNFGAGSLAIKAGLLGTSFVIQRWALRHNPKLYKTFGWMNVAIAGGLGAAAAHNVAIR